MKRVYGGFVLAGLAMAGCRSAPTQPPVTTPAPSTVAPAPSRPLVLGLSGQSNAGMIRPFLEERATVVGYATVLPIAPCWDPAGSCWEQLRVTLRPDLDAFIWWHGDIEAERPRYTEPMADLFRRVRAETRNPKLPIVILQLGSVNGDDPESAGGQALRWTQQDPDAIYVETRDKEYKADRQHMADQGYRDVVARIVDAVRAKQKTR